MRHYTNLKASVALLFLLPLNLVYVKDGRIRWMNEDHEIETDEDGILELVMI